MRHQPKVTGVVAKITATTLRTKAKGNCSDQISCDSQWELVTEEIKEQSVFIAIKDSINSVKI